MLLSRMLLRLDQITSTASFKPNFISVLYHDFVLLPPMLSLCFRGAALSHPALPLQICQSGRHGPASNLLRNTSAMAAYVSELQCARCAPCSKSCWVPACGPAQNCPTSTAGNKSGHHGCCLLPSAPVSRQPKCGSRISPSPAAPLPAGSTCGCIRWSGRRRRGPPPGCCWRCCCPPDGGRTQGHLT